MDTLISILALAKLQNTIINEWIGPIFITAIAIFALAFIKDRAWMKLIGFIGIASIVGVLVFAGDGIFGPDGQAPGIVNDLANDIK